MHQNTHPTPASGPTHPASADAPYPAPIDDSTTPEISETPPASSTSCARYTNADVACNALAPSTDALKERCRMKRLIEGEDRTQITLLPECLDDYISEDNPVRVMDVFVDQLNLASLDIEGIAPATTGRPA